MIDRNIQDKMRLLTAKERRYFRAMWSKYGVLYITAMPGVGKSAIIKSVADKMGYHFVDFRLSMADETDFKFPYVYDANIDGVSKKVSAYAIPEWAYLANTRPTILFFDEINRAPIFVLNASLQILLDRAIGEFKFNDNVLMVACGNKGDADGTEVQELDNAHNNRLIHVSYELSLEEWIEDFGNNNCHKSIIEFLRAYPQHFITEPDDTTRAFSRPRSWTMLSEYIIKNWGLDSNPTDFIEDLREIAFGCVGNSAHRYIRYCEEQMTLSIRDIISDYKKAKKKLEKFNSDKVFELVQSLKSIPFNNLTDSNLDNVYLFLCDIGEEHRMSYLLYLVDDNSEDKDLSKGSKFYSFLIRFKEDFERVLELSNL